MFTESSIALGAKFGGSSSIIGVEGGGGTPPAPFTNTLSVVFDGSNDHVTIPTVAAQDLTSAVTVSFWIKGSSQGTEKTLFSKWQTGAGDLRSFLIDTDVTNDTRLRLGIYDDTTTLQKNYVTSLALLTGSWTHYAFTFGSSTLKVYANGAEDTSVNKSIDNAISSINITNTPYIMAGRSAPSNFYAGNLDEISLWTSELTASDISAIYNSGTPTDLSTHAKTANLVGWYRNGDGDTFPTLTDQQGNSNGTMTSMTAGDIVTDTAP